MYPIHQGRTDFPQSLPHPGLPTQFILTSSLVRLSLPVASCPRFLHQHNTSWGPLADSYKIIVCHLGATTLDVQFILGGDFFYLPHRRDWELLSPCVKGFGHV